VIILLLRSEQKRGESWTAWSKDLEDFVGGSCKGALDSGIGEFLQVVNGKATAPAFAAGQEISVEAIRESEKLKSFERGNAGQTVLTKVLALLAEAQHDWGSYKKHSKPVFSLPQLFFNRRTCQS